MQERLFINMPIPADRFEAVCALLGGAAMFAALQQKGNEQQRVLPDALNASRDTVKSSSTDEMLTPESQGSAGTGASDASLSDDGEVDAHGHPWSADLHASTKGKTKDGLWRMKVGVTRPDPKPGFPTTTGTAPETPTPSATSPGAGAPGSGQPATSTEEEDDEFAAFREAANKSDKVDENAAAAVPERQYSDGDLGALCNQAAVKLGDPTPVKALIADYVPTGEVAHSRNIPADKRAEFVKAVEDKAGIQFAG